MSVVPTWRRGLSQWFRFSGRLRDVFGATKGVELTACSTPRRLAVRRYRDLISCHQALRRSNVSAAARNRHLTAPLIDVLIADRYREWIVVEKGRD
jgi:hypothetical protein